MLKLLIQSLGCAFLLVSCHHENETILSTMQDIQDLGDKEPRLAISRLDSMTEDIPSQSEYIQMKYELLNIRLHDKADDMPESDKPIKKVLSYFSDHGSLREQQEAYHYAGSIYRDLKDAPTAIRNFLQAEYLAEKAGTKCDSAILVRTYSNLSYLHHNLGDYNRSLYYAKKEYELSTKIGMTNYTSVMHIADSYYYLDSIDEAYKYYHKALIHELASTKNDFNTVAGLLRQYTKLKNEIVSDTCYWLMLRNYKEVRNNPSSNVLVGLGDYFALKNITDSALFYYKWAIDQKTNLLSEYSAAWKTYHYYAEKEDWKNARLYADILMAAHDSMQLSKQQKLAADVNNWYKYMRDREEEQKILDDNRAHHERLIWTIVFFVLVGLLGYTLFFYYRNRQLQKIAFLDQKVKNVNDELRHVSEELSKNEKELEEKNRMNNNVLNLLHRTQFEQNAEAYIAKLKDAAQGKRDLEPGEWNHLYKSIDTLWPDFKETMCRNLSPLTEGKKKACYLKRAGFSNYEIEILSGLSRSTVWRLLSQNDWICQTENESPNSIDN